MDWEEIKPEQEAQEPTKQIVTVPFRPNRWSRQTNRSHLDTSVRLTPIRSVVSEYGHDYDGTGQSQLS